MSIAMSTSPVVGGAAKNIDLTDVKETKAYTQGEESTDDQAYCSTDEGLSNSDSDSSRSSSKARSALTSESSSRRGSNASSEGVPEMIITELLPSVGSVGHFTGECNRCCFFPKGRCSNGQNCNYCHFDHERRPRRSKRGGAKNTAEEEDTASSSGSTSCEPAPVPVLVKPPGLFSPAEEPAAPVPVMVKPPGLFSPVNSVSCKPAAVEPPAPAPVMVKPPGLLTPVNSSKRLMVPHPLPAFQAQAAMHNARPSCIPTPMGRMGHNSARLCAAPASLQCQEGREAAQMMQVSGGRPVKVWLQEGASSKHLKPTIPAKKKPPYPESIATSRPVLDASQPVKKRVPVFSEDFLSGLLSQLVPGDDVSEAPTDLVPR